MLLLLLSDITKVLNFQGSVSGELQSAFSTCARGPPFPVQVWQRQRHLPTCTCCARLGCLLLISPGKPLEPSSPLQPWASYVQQQSSPVPQVHFLYGIRHKVTMLNVFTGLCSLWRMLWLRHNMILQAAFNDTPGLCRDRCGISNPQYVQREWANRVRPSHCLPV